MDVEDEGLTAARAHHGEHTAALFEGVECLHLRAMGLGRTDERVNEAARELVVGKTSQRGAAIGVDRDRARADARGLRRAVPLPRPLSDSDKGLVRGDGLLTRAAQNVLDHELGLHTPLPALGNRLEHKVDHRIAIHQLLDLGRPEHDRRHARGSIRGDKAHVVARLAHDRAVTHRHTAGGQQGDAISLAEWLEHSDLTDGLDVELVEPHRGGNLAPVLEILGRKIGQHRVQAVAQGVEVLDRAGDADGAGMASEANEQVGALLHRLEQVHATHRAARSTGNAVLDGEQQRRHVITVDQTARNDALHTLVPALPAHDNGAAAVVRALGELLGLTGELGLDCTALLIYLLERSGEAAGLHGIAGE